MTNITHTPAPWNAFGVVKCCSMCDGEGVIASHRRPTIDDPFPQDDCECGLGKHEAECEVCGFNQVTAGADCLVCDMVANLHDHEVRALNVDAFTKALTVAVAAARAQIAK